MWDSRDTEPDEPGWWLASDGRWYSPESADAQRRGLSPRSRFVIIAACELVVLIGFIGTLQSVATDDIDGLNFLPNVLFGLPWNLLVAPIVWITPASGNVFVEAAIDFLAASLNVLILWRLLARSARRRAAP